MAPAFKLVELPGPIARLTFDTPGKKVNTLSQSVRAELAEIVGRLEQRTDLRGLLLDSGKPGQFIAGAELSELAALVEPGQIQAVLAAGHELFDRISKLPFPTVALIDGPCMGGGSELALAFDERLAGANPKCQIGFPEVTIGLIPAWGGTQRLPRLIGFNDAIDMICSGAPVPSRRAAELGLVLDAVASEKLIEEGVRLIAYLQESDKWQHRRELRRQPLGLSESQMQSACQSAAEKIELKTQGHPSAAPVALKAIERGINRPLDEGLAVEREVAMEVFGSEMASNLIAVFFMKTALSRDRGVADKTVQPRKIERVGVLGSGLMGAGIATACAQSGLPCAMADISSERLADGMSRAQKVIEGRSAAGGASSAAVLQAIGNLSTSTSLDMFADRDVVIEAITENEALKTQAYRQLGQVLRDDAILCTNTSTISISRMAQAARNPERFVGMHFFYPVDRMPLVEVIRGDRTSDETIATIVELARRLRKIPIVCRDCPGFLVNRILLPYMSEALRLLLEGADMDQIDRVAVRFGFPLGPIALFDLVGNDTAHYANNVLAAAYSERMSESPLLADLVQAGRLGKKSGAGFRKFAGERRSAAPDAEFAPFLERHRIDSRTFADEEIEDRLLLAMLLEAVRVLEDRVVREAMHVDMGLILGIAFPSFRGGLLRWCDNIGAGKLLDRLSKYTALGKRFEPTDAFVAMGRSNGRFFP